MRAYIAQLPPLGWLAVLLPALVVVRSVVMLLMHSAMPAAVCGFLRLI